VSKKIREEFENGRAYYALHGQQLMVVPPANSDRPGLEFLDWHNRNVYLG
jgi:putative restriction endonuclease